MFASLPPIPNCLHTSLVLYKLSRSAFHPPMEEPITLFISIIDQALVRINDIPEYLAFHFIHWIMIHEGIEVAGNDDMQCCLLSLQLQL